MLRRFHGHMNEVDSRTVWVRPVRVVASPFRFALHAVRHHHVVGWLAAGPDIDAGEGREVPGGLWDADAVDLDFAVHDVEAGLSCVR